MPKHIATLPYAAFRGHDGLRLDADIGTGYFLAEWFERWRFLKPLTNPAGEIEAFSSRGGRRERRGNLG